MDLSAICSRTRLAACWATALAAGLLADGGTVEAARAPELRLATIAGATTVEAAGLAPAVLEDLHQRGMTDGDWRRAFPLYTGAELPAAEGRPAVAGSWSIEGRVLRFRPRFPLVPGLAYVARLDLSTLHPRLTDPPAAVEATFELPAETLGPATVVRQVYPTASELPENLLRLYVHFSAPMSRGEAYHHLRLLDASGRPVDRPFLEVGEELWDPGQRRLTLFFDPGRIKRGLRPHAEAGPPLEAGETYTLVIDAGWRDADGRPLSAGFEKTFTTTAPDREVVDAADWQLEAPPANSREPLVLRFPEPLDHGLLERVVTVRDGSGRALFGDVAIGSEERSFTFRPERSWRPGDYAVAVETLLEDVAGNNLRQVFDLDAAAGQTASDQEVVSLPFRVTSE